MAGNLDDLEFELSVGLEESLKNLREVNEYINGAKGLTADLSGQFAKLNQATMQLATSGMLPVHNSELLMAGLGSIGRSVEAITGQFNRMATRLDTAVGAASEDIGVQWLQITKGVTNGTAEMRRFAEQAKAAAAATQTIIVDTATNKMQTPKQTPFEIVKLASAALAVQAMTGITKSVTSARVAIQDISKTTTLSVTAMDRFRLAMQAPKVNPAFNFLKTAIDAVSGSAANATEFMRKTADAILSDLPGALGVAVTGIGKLVGSLDRVQLTASKWISKLQTMSTGMKLFGFVFGSSSRNASLLNAVIKFAQPLLEKFSTLVDRGNQYLKMLLETAREAGQVLTGTFVETGTSADLYARAAWAATVPTRLIAREMEGGARVVRVAKFAFMAITQPLTALTLAVKHSSGEFRDLQSRLPKLQNSIGIVRTAMGAATATVRQMDSAYQMLRVKAMDAATAFVASSPRAASAIIRLRDSVIALQAAAKNSGPAFAAAFPRIAAATASLTATFKILRDGALKPIAAEVTRVAQIIGAKLAADVNKSVAAVAKYVKSWELGIRVHRALSITVYGVSKAFTVVRAVVGPVATGIFRVASAAYGAVSAMRSLSGSVVSVTAKLTGLNAAASASKAAVSGGLSSIANKASFANLAISGLAAGVIAMSANFAMATEKNQAVFGVMVKDMDQGQAIVADLQNSAAVGLFDNEEVLNSGRLLFKAGVAAVDLRGKTEQLATIAAATSTELGDLTRIYQQGANRGSFGQDKINQLAERGIDIYHGLTAATGKSGEELSKMITNGQIGLTEMDAALAYLTEGNGIYAGSLAKLGETTSGMLAQIKNNLMQALGGMGAVGNDAFKPVLSAILAMSEGIKGSVGAVAPVVTQLFMVIRGVFTGIWSVVSSVFTGIYGAGAATFGALLATTMDWFTKFRWYFENLLPIAQFVWLNIASGAVTMFNDIAYFITDVIPAYLTWFAENWTNVFTDIAMVTGTIFENIMNNVVNAMTVIWDYIASGGTSKLEFAWTPLLTGFESTVAALPDIPERAMTALEESLQQQTQQIGTQLADSFDALNLEAQAALTVAPPEMPAIDPTLGGGAVATGEGDGTGKQGRTDFSVSGLERGSEAALKAIFSAQKDKTPSQQLSEAKKQTALLAKMADRPEPAVLGGV